MKSGNVLKICISMTALLALLVTALSSCGTTQVNYGLYEDAVADLKAQEELYMTINQEITTIISGGSSTTTSHAEIKGIDLGETPVFQIAGTIKAIGANVNYDMYYENGVCYMDLYGAKTKVEGDLAVALQNYVGISVKDIDINTLLDLTQEELSVAVLQSQSGLNILTVEVEPEKFGTILGYDASKLSTVVVTYSIDQNRHFTAITVETDIDTTYAQMETNIDFKLEISFLQSEEEIEIATPEDLEAYAFREEES